MLNTISFCLNLVSSSALNSSVLYKHQNAKKHVFFASAASRIFLYSGKLKTKISGAYTVKFDTVFFTLICQSVLN